MNKGILKKTTLVSIVLCVAFIIFSSCSNKASNEKQILVTQTLNQVSNTSASTNSTSFIDSATNREIAITETINEKFYTFINSLKSNKFEDPRYKEFFESKAGTINSTQVKDTVFYWSNTGFSSIILITKVINGTESIIYNDVVTRDITSVKGYNEITINEKKEPYSFFEYATYAGASSNMTQFVTILCEHNNIVNKAWKDAVIEYESGYNSKCVKSSVLVTPPFDEPLLFISTLNGNTGIAETSETYYFEEDSMSFRSKK